MCGLHFLKRTQCLVSSKTLLTRVPLGKVSWLGKRNASGEALLQQCGSLWPLAQGITALVTVRNNSQKQKFQREADHERKCVTEALQIV